jgi:hypothetical protein
VELLVSLSRCPYLAAAVRRLPLRPARVGGSDARIAANEIGMARLSLQPGRPGQPICRRPRLGALAVFGRPDTGVTFVAPLPASRRRRFYILLAARRPAAGSCCCAGGGSGGRRERGGFQPRDEACSSTALRRALDYWTASRGHRRWLRRWDGALGLRNCFGSRGLSAQQPRVAGSSCRRGCGRAVMIGALTASALLRLVVRRAGGCGCAGWHHLKRRRDAVDYREGAVDLHHRARR